jgi:hypothetical protein
MQRSGGVRLRLSWVLGLAFSLSAWPALAAEIGEEGSLLSVDVHAFASQGFILTTDNNYLANDTTHGSFQLSEVGINFTKAVTDKLGVGVQLFAQDLGVAGNYNAKVDWFYIDYRQADWLGFRAGRVKIPFGLYNEFNAIGLGFFPHDRCSGLTTKRFVRCHERSAIPGSVRDPRVGHALNGERAPRARLEPCGHSRHARQPGRRPRADSGRGPRRPSRAQHARESSPFHSRSCGRSARRGKRRRPDAWSLDLLLGAARLFPPLRSGCSPPAHGRMGPERRGHRSHRGSRLAALERSLLLSSAP